MKHQRLITLAIIAVALVGLGLLVRDIGLQKLLDQLLAVAWAFPFVLLAEGLSNATSTVGWYHAFPVGPRPPLRKLMSISFASLAVAGVLPTGQASELTKWNLLRGHAHTADVVSSLVVFNYLHVACTLGMVLVGPAVALITGHFPDKAVWSTLLVAVVCFGGALFGGWLLARGMLARALYRLGGLKLFAFARKPKVQDWAGAVDTRLSATFKREGTLVQAAAWLLVGRLFAIVEVWIILSALGAPSPATTALMVFSATAVVNYVLLVLPAREGVLEASTYGVFVFLGLPGEQGLSLELIRRIRKVAYQAAGVVLLVILGRKARPASADGPDGAATPPHPETLTETFTETLVDEVAALEVPAAETEVP